MKQTIDKVMEKMCQATLLIAMHVPEIATVVIVGAMMVVTLL